MACETACVADGVDVPLSGDTAVTQLCAPAPGQDDPFARPSSRPEAANVAETSACEGKAYVCLAGRVIACGTSSVVGTCIHGCVADDLAMGDEQASRVSGSQAEAILCRRSVSSP